VTAKKKTSYRWHLRRLMAGKDIYATTVLRPLLAERGVTLSRAQVYRLVTGTPERLSLATLAALCDILGCGPGDLVEPVRAASAGRPAPGGPAAPTPRPVRARVAGPAGRLPVARCPAGHEVPASRLPRCPRLTTSGASKRHNIN
jgi:DNA-binding Xre family transcriptional regulator